MFKKLALAALVASAAVAAPAFAQEDKTVSIDGEVNQRTTLLGANTVVATGFLSDAESHIGTINNADVGGSVNQTTMVMGANTVVSTGFLSDACSSIGAIGESC